MWRFCVDRGVGAAVFAEQLAELGREEELRARAKAGDWFAMDQLCRLLVKQQRTRKRSSSSRRRADHGNEIDDLELAVLLARNGQEEKLRSLVAAGGWLAAERLVGVLVDQDRVGEAAEILQVHGDNGIGYAATRLAELLSDHGREEEALKLWQVLAQREDGAYASNRLAQLLAKQGREKDLQARVDGGCYGAAEQLIKFVAKERGPEEAERLRRYGQMPDR